MTTSIGSPQLPQTTSDQIADPLAAGTTCFVPICDGARYLPFTVPALRDLKFKAFDRKNSRGDVIKGNGTGPAGVWVQIGAKVLIDLHGAYRWLESNRAERK